jgi:hypothetical protein
MRRYHHMGIPTTEKKEGEVYDPKLKYTSTPYDANEFHVQWHRFDDDCPLPEIVKTTPHVAFQVDDLNQEVEGRNIILGPYSPIEGFRVAVIEENGAVVEFIETDLTDEEIAALQKLKSS